MRKKQVLLIVGIIIILLILIGVYAVSVIKKTSEELFGKQITESDKEAQGILQQAIENQESSKYYVEYTSRSATNVYTYGERRTKYFEAQYNQKRELKLENLEKNDPLFQNSFVIDNIKYDCVDGVCVKFTPQFDTVDYYSGYGQSFLGEFSRLDQANRLAFGEEIKK